MVGSLIFLHLSTSTDFLSTGLGAIVTASSCEVTEELGGDYSLRMTCSMNDPLFEYIQARNILVVKPNKYDPPQGFRIQRLSKNLKGEVTVDARHISYDLAGYPVRAIDYSEGILTPSAMLGYMHHYLIYQSSLFTFKYDTTGPVSDTPFYCGVQSARSFLLGEESIVSKWGGEFKFDNFVVNYTGTGFRGKDRGFTIRYGKNMIDFEQETYISNMYTAVLPYYVVPSGGWEVAGTYYLATNAYDEDLKIGYDTNPVMSIDGEYRKYYTSEPGFVFQDNYYPSIMQKYGFMRILDLDLTDYKGEYETLYSAAERYIKEYGLNKPHVSMTVNFASLSESSDVYNQSALEELELGDVIHVYFERMGSISDARCTSLTYDVLRGRYTSIRLGEPLITLTGILGGTNRYN